MNEFIKKSTCNVLASLKVDGMMRYLNRTKLMVVMYHGVTRNRYDPPVWTQLPEEIFLAQMKYIKSHYNILHLSSFISFLRSGKDLPDRSALITFDDGLRNNYSVAFPILKRLTIPATIFLTTNFIDTERIFWFDELLFLIRQKVKQNEKIVDEIMANFGSRYRNDVWNAYFYMVNKMKRMSEDERNIIMDQLRDNMKMDSGLMLDDFGLMKWDHILEMERSGIIDFGAHTANHRILANISEELWDEEMKEPRATLSKILGKDIVSFCFPNGIPEVDFNERHIDYLRACGYICAFTTEASLYSPGKVDPFRIGRIPAGNDLTSHMAFFKLACAGL